MLIMLAVIISKFPSQDGSPMHNAMADTTVVNPNGASELAILMRQMQEYSSAEKKRVLNDMKPTVMPRSFENIGTAKITEGMHRSDNYDTFAGLYLDQVKAYLNAGKGEERVSAYNNMVATCLACHSEHCPGPVPVIRKLMINKED